MKLLDLYCGAGGASVGYARAGFEVTGVDIVPQPHYPFEFYQSDALEYLEDYWTEFNFVHASPPCQKFSRMSQCRPGLSEQYPDLVDATRAALRKTGLPYILENVEGSPLRPDVVLCGHMFGLPLYRHRVFELSDDLPVPTVVEPDHLLPTSRAGHWVPGTIMSVAGHVAPIAEAKRAMGIDWMSREELSEAIPPAYTEFLGKKIFGLEGQI